MSYLIVRNGQNKVLVVSIDHRERHLTMMILTEEWISCHILKRVMHPSHIPLKAKAKTAEKVGRDTPVKAVDSSAMVMA